MFGYSELVRDETENRVQLGFDIGGENLWTHSENSREVFLMNAFGLEERDYGMDGIERSGVERRV